MLVYCWSSVVDAGPTLNQHWIRVLSLTGWHGCTPCCNESLWGKVGTTLSRHFVNVKYGRGRLAALSAVLMTKGPTLSPENTNISIYFPNIQHNSILSDSGQDLVKCAMMNCNLYFSKNLFGLSHVYSWNALTLSPITVNMWRWLECWFNVRPPSLTVAQH